MKSKISRLDLSVNIHNTLGDPQAIKNLMDDITELPPTLYEWLGRLKLLYGVPFNYLVPDIGMLPPESIRFFYLDQNWVNALIDGAYSIGRNLSVGDSECSNVDKNIDESTLDQAHQQSVNHAMNIRPNFLGLDDPGASYDAVCGFILRSEVVKNYPGLGVNAYAKGHTPQDPDPQLINILRMEKLGKNSDTLICLLDADPVRVDIHEAPEVLHYGIDAYNYNSKTKEVTASKSIWEFTRDGDDVHLETDKPKLDMDLADSFRPQASVVNKSKSRRTLMTDSLAELMKTTLSAHDIDTTIFDSAEFGVEMVEGVGNVKFMKEDPG